MQRLYFEKQIDLDHALQELVSISVNENLKYLDDIEGKKAIGNLEITGEYLTTTAKQQFHDAIEMDILAPFDRLEENENFRLEIIDFDYHIQNGDINIEIQVAAYGVGEKKERHIVVAEPIDDEASLLEEIQNLVAKQELIDSIEESLNSFEDATSDEIDTEETLNSFEATTNEVDVIENVESEDEKIEPELLVEEARLEENTIEEVEKEVPQLEKNTISEDEEESIVAKEVVVEETVIEEVTDTTSIPLEQEDELDDIWHENENVDVEDLFDDDMMAFVTYPIYVVKENDSYEAIANHYNLDSDTLMAYNHHVALTPHQLLIIPPQ